MSRTIHRAPLALASDGTILLNTAVFDVPKRIEQLLELALRERGAVFIGIALAPHEVEQLRLQVDDAVLQAAFFTAGARQRRSRQRGR
ncbi:MAG TPA: hypothetical protein PLI95_31160 [Polyangiaceae bacterium]|nr:hypothetical protein [Polyangiaceae bacterium]